MSESEKKELLSMAKSLLSEVREAIVELSEIKAVVAA